MADEMELRRKAENLFLNGQIEHAKATLIEGLKVYPESIAIQDLLHKYQDIKPINIEQENEKVKQCKIQNERELDQIIKNHKIKQDIGEINEKNNFNANSSFQKRITTLIMELNELIHNENDTWKKIQTSVQLNCYEFTIEANESDRAEALKCFAMAEVAFREGRNERAEHLLVKALRICDSQTAKTFLETVRNAKGQNNSSVKTEKSYEYGYDHSLNEYNLEYSKSIYLAEKAIAEGDLDKAEHFFSKAIRIYPNDKARKQLEHINNVRPSQPSSDKTLKSDDYLKSEGEAEILIDLAIKAMTLKVFDLACVYLEWALEKQPNEHTRELLQDAKIKQNSCNRRSSQSKYLFKFNANKLLDEAENLIRDGHLKKAETFLIVSWDMNRSRRTTFVHKKFLEARLARFERDEKHKRDGTNNGNSKNIFDSDKLVKTALEKIGKKNFEEAKELLMRAAEFYPSERIDKLLAEIGGVNTEDGTFKTMNNSCKNYVKKLF